MSPASGTNTTRKRVYLPFSQDGQFLQIEDDDDDSDFELPKVKKVPKVKKKRTSKTKLLQLEDDDDDSDFEAPKVKKERTSTKKSPPVVETSNSSVAEWLPPVGSMVHVKWQYRQVWRAKTKGYVEDENDPDNLAVHFTFPTGEVWDCNLIQFNERVTLHPRDPWDTVLGAKSRNPVRVPQERQELVPRRSLR